MGTHARVRVTLDVPAGSSWSDDVTVKQVREQASKETVQKLENIFLKEGIRVVLMEPVVTVYSELERK